MGANRTLGHDALAAADLADGVDPFTSSADMSRGALDASPVAVRELTLDGTISYVNAAHCRLFGWDAEALVGCEVWELLEDPRARRELRLHLRDIAEREPEPTPFPCAELTETGNSLPLRVTWRYQRDYTGRLTGFVWWLQLIAVDCEPVWIPDERPYKALIDSMNEGVGLVHRNGSFAYVNARLCEILGYSRRELIGRSVFVIGDDDSKRMLAAERSRRMAGEPGRYEITHIHPSGRSVCLAVSGHPAFDERGEFAGSFAVVTDITERRRERGLRRRQAQIFEQLFDAVLVLDKDRKIVDCNTAAVSLFGYAKASLLGLSGRALQSPRERPELSDEITETLGSRGRWTGEICVRRANGTEALCEVAIGRFSDPEGGASAYISISRDITERKRVERELRESDERYRQLVEMFSDSVIVHGEGGRILFANNAAATLYRAGSVGELMRHRWTDLLAPEDRESSTRRSEKIRTGAIIVSRHDLVRRRLDGSAVEVEGTARRIVWHGRPAVMGVTRDVTERRRAEDALRRSEAKFRNLVQGTVLGYEITAEEGTLLFCNDAFARMYGYGSAIELQQVRDMRAHLEPGEHDRIENHRRAVLAGQGPRDFELQGQRKGGSPMWLAGSMSLVEWDGANAVQATWVDITKRRNAELALRQSEAQFRLVTDALPGLVSYIDRDLRYQFNNKTYEDWYGMPREQIRGMPVRDFIQRPDSYHEIRRWLERGLAGETVTFERRSRSKARRFMRGTYVPDLDENGSVRGVVGLITDISESWKRDNTLRLQAALLDNMAEGVGVVQPRDGRIVYANPKLLEVMGYSADELNGRHVRVLLPRGKIRRVAPLVRALRTAGIWTGELQSETKRGQTLWCRGTITTFDHPDHGPVWVGVFADVTEQKKAVEALRRAKDEADRANAAKSRFLAAASHDLRQPLQAANLFLAALNEADRAPDRHEIMNDLGVALRSMGSLLNALLDVSRLEVGAVEPEITDFNLGNLLDQLATEFRAQARDKNLDFRFVPSYPTVRTDPSLLSRIVANFLANAIQYTQSGRVLLGCRHLDQAIRIEVWDTGCGVPDDKREVIFEEFYQLDRPNRDRSKGLGLGLAIAKRTAFLLDHDIHLTSEVGRGTMFAVEVPRGSAEREAAAVDRWSRIVQGDIAGSILAIVEDDAHVLRATQRLLEGWGAVVVVASTVADLVAQVAETGVQPDVLIADYQLPDETGMAARDKLNRMCGGDVPTIVMTGAATSERLDRIAAASGALVMLKPVNPAELRLMVRNLLRETQAA